MKQNSKIVIYQLLPRLFGNMTKGRVPNGTIEQNGCGKMNDINEQALTRIKRLGVTHVWFTGIIEHATKTDYSQFGIKPCNPYVVKGNAGSPYAILDYYDIAPDLAVDVAKRQEEFDALVQRTHDAGLKVILDFIPNHVAREYHSDAKPAGVKDLGEGDDSSKAFDRDNNFYYMPGQGFAPHIDLGFGDKQYREFPARATGNDCFHAYPGVNDWYETVKLNYGVDYMGNTGCHFSPIPSTWHKMLNILKYWTARGVDGFRCDMAHMVPVEFWHWAIAQIKAIAPHMIFVAELYDTSIYHRYVHEGGFDYLYNKVTLYDTLFSVVRGHSPASDITHCWQSLEGLEDHMLNFLENHDELRIASPQFAGDAFKGIPALAVSLLMSRAPFMLYYGQELGEPALDAEGFSGADGRTTIFDYWTVDKLARWNNGGKFSVLKLNAEERELRNTYQKFLHVALTEKAVSDGDFFDLMYVNGENLNPHRQYAFLRHVKGELLVVAVNFDDVPVAINLNIPDHAFDLYDIRPGMTVPVELINGEMKKYNLSPNRKFSMNLEAHGASVWKIKFVTKSVSRNRRKKN